MVLTLAEIARQLGGDLQGDGGIEISGVATLTGAQTGQISFLANPKYQKQLFETAASAVLLRPQDAPFCEAPCIKVADPYLAYAMVVALLNPPKTAPAGIHPSAVVDESAQVDATASIGPQCVVEAGAVIAAGVQLGAGCLVDERAAIGRDSTLKANVTIYHNCVIGERGIIHSGAVIGSDGFGFANDQGRWVKIQQIGQVIVGDDVEIGANTAIDRGAIDDTVIGDGVKVDNLVQIAHNVRIGDHTAIAGQSGVAGSTEIGKNCAIAGMVGIAGHIKICDNVTFTGKTMVIKSIAEPGIYSSGLPAEANKNWNKKLARMRQLDDMAKRLKQLEQQIKDKS